ncbi:MAG TPA: peptidase M48 [Bacteroidetes bacterium]|nr:peptidase M48 [Bacteroidota bacterium]
MPNNLNRIHIVPLIFLLLGLFLGCATTGINRYQPNLFTKAQEQELGGRFAAEVEKQFKLYTRKEVVSYVNEIGQRLVQVSDWPDLPFHFKVIDDTAQVNAFALPGGYIYVYTGLLKTAENEAELAGVLAHEIGHVTARHATERLTLMYGYSAAVKLLLGENPNEIANLVANLFATGGLLAYSRKNELEADKLGLRYLARAGYDPHGFLSFLEKLQRLYKREPSRLEIWFSTHPATSERIERTRKAIARMGNPTGKVNETGYRKIKALIP